MSGEEMRSGFGDANNGNNNGIIVRKTGSGGEGGADGPTLNLTGSVNVKPTPWWASTSAKAVEAILVSLATGQLVLSIGDTDINIIGDVVDTVLQRKSDDRTYSLDDDGYIFQEIHLLRSSCIEDDVSEVKITGGGAEEILRTCASERFNLGTVEEKLLYGTPLPVNDMRRSYVREGWGLATVEIERIYAPRGVTEVDDNGEPIDRVSPCVIALRTELSRPYLSEIEGIDRCLASTSSELYTLEVRKPFATPVAETAEEEMLEEPEDEATSAAVN